MEYIKVLADEPTMKLRWLIWGSFEGAYVPEGSDGYQITSSLAYSEAEVKGTDVEGPSGACVAMLERVDFNTTGSVCHYVSGGRSEAKYLSLAEWEKIVDAEEPLTGRNPGKRVKNSKAAKRTIE
jgi:hypothetical protein